MLTLLLYLVFLRPDPARKPLPPADGERIQTAHMANIRSMAANGVLLSAGPFAVPPGDKPATISGIFILKAASLAEARRIAAGDPTVVEHRNTVDVYAWRGPADLAEEYFRLHKANPDTPEGMAEHPFCLIYKGPNWQASPAAAELIDRFHAAGQLGAGGPVEGDASLLGLAIFKPGLVADARKLLEADAALKSGQFRIEYHNWWSSAHVLPW